MTVDFNAAMPSRRVLTASIKGMKKELHVHEWVLLRRSRAKNVSLQGRYWAKCGNTARKVIKLKHIIKHLEAMEIISRYQKLKAA